MKKLLLMILMPYMLCAISLTPNAPVPITSDASVESPVSVAYNSVSGTYMAVWFGQVDEMGFQIIYSTSTDNGSTWSTPTPYPNTNFPTAGESPPFVAAQGSEFLIAWIDNTPPGISTGNILATLSSDNGATWNSPVGVSPMMTPGNVAALWLHSSSNGYLVTWWRLDDHSLNSSFSSDGISWGALSQIDMDGSDAPGSQPIVTGEGMNYLAAWVTVNDNVFTSYSTDLGSTWGTKSLVASTGNPGIFPTPILITDGYLVIWQNTAGNSFSSFSSDNGTTWGTANTISDAVNTGYTPPYGIGISGEAFITAVFGVDTSGRASISSDDGVTWAPFVTFSTGYPFAGINGNFGDIAQGSTGYLVTWIDNSLDAISAFFPASSLSPPTNLSGTSSTNLFLFEKQFYANLQWEASPSVSAVGYHVKRDGTLVGTTTGLFFNDQSISRHSTYTYTVTAVDSSGSESSAVTLVLSIP